MGSSSKFSTAPIAQKYLAIAYHLLEYTMNLFLFKVSFIEIMFCCLFYTSHVQLF